MNRKQASHDPARKDPEHEASVNQRKHEPTPASHEADSHQAAPARNEEHTAARPRDPAVPGDVLHGAPAVQGDAVRDMMGGPPPQGDVPDAPGTQVAAAEEGERGPRARHVANAVPGKPDGEVDTRS
jgi:hypothetical protein